MIVSELIRILNNVPQDYTVKLSMGTLVVDDVQSRVIARRMAPTDENVVVIYPASHSPVVRDPFVEENG